MGPKNSPIKIDDLIKGLENGEYSLPDFQREYVWEIEQAILLIDSLFKGYPLGSFIFWKTKEKLKTWRPIESAPCSTIEHDTYIYVLDGQQRITTLYKCLKGTDEYSNIFLDLTAFNEQTATPNDSAIVYAEGDKIPNNHIKIKLKTLYENRFSVVRDELKSQAAENDTYVSICTKMRDALIGYDFNAILIDCDLSTATDIFTRLNTGGEPLNVFEIMVAKTFSEEFSLKDKTENLCSSFESFKLEFEKHKMLILQAMALCLGKKNILKLEKQDIVDNFNGLENAFKLAINYIKNTFRTPHMSIFPYKPLLLPYVYFFFKLNKGKEKGEAPTTGLQEKWLKDFYWRSIFTQRYSSSSDTNVSTDIENVIDPILCNLEPDLNKLQGISFNVDDFIKNGNFHMSSYIKGIVCFLIYKHPLSLKNNSEINFDTTWPSKASNSNYHHFFPLKMKNSSYTRDELNNICNIILLDASTNKYDIKNRHPSDYINSFKNSNSCLESTLKSHFINSIIEFGITTDDFYTFRLERAKAIITSIKENTQPCPKDTYILTPTTNNQTKDIDAADENQTVDVTKTTTTD